MEVLTHGSFDEGPIVLALPPFMEYEGVTAEIDPVFTAWDKHTGISITQSQISDGSTIVNTDHLDHISITTDGTITASNITGSNTGDQNISVLVPYTGATSNVTLGSKNLAANKVTINAAPTLSNDAITKGYFDTHASTGIIWLKAVIDIVSSLPGSATLGDRYIHSTTNDICEWNGASWDATAPSQGNTLYVTADTLSPTNSIGQYNFNGTSWVFIGGASSIIEHNDTTNKEGGDGTHYYHLGDSANSVLPNVIDTSMLGVPTGLVCTSSGVNTNADGTETAYVVLEWDAISSSIFDHYQIRYKKSSLSRYSYITSNTNTLTIEGLTTGLSYNIGVASITKYGTQSAYCADITQVASVDTTPPATVTGVTATGGIQNVILNWTSNTEADLDAYKVYRYTSDNSSSSTEIAKVSTNYFIDTKGTVGTTYYYWVKAIDASDNLSASYSTSVYAKSRNVASVDASLGYLGWTQTCTFSAPNSNTVYWSGGTFTSSKGTSYTISAGNTGVMSARTYIYLDADVSTTTYQTTTNSTLSVGDNKVCVATAINTATQATFYVFGGSGGVQIDGDNIAAGSIVSDNIAGNTITGGNIKGGTVEAGNINTSSITNLSNLVIGTPQITLDGATTFMNHWQDLTDVTKINGGSIQANTVTADKISASTLSAISADLGNVNAGEVVISNGGNSLWLNNGDSGSLAIGGAVESTAPFRVTSAGVMTATAGTVGGWVINGYGLTKDTGVESTSSGMDPLNVSFYAGATPLNRMSAPFHVLPNGDLYASNLNISSLSETYIPICSDAYGLIGDSPISVSAYPGNMVIHDRGLDIQSTNRGLIVPRMTSTQIGAISGVEDGMIVYNSQLGYFMFYQGGGWHQVNVY